MKRLGNIMNSTILRYLTGFPLHPLPEQSDLNSSELYNKTIGFIWLIYTIEFDNAFCWFRALELLSTENSTFSFSSEIIASIKRAMNLDLGMSPLMASIFLRSSLEILNDIISFIVYQRK
jgi:hypothetical protein